LDDLHESSGAPNVVNRSRAISLGLFE